MSIRALSIALAITLALAVAAFFLLRPTASTGGAAVPWLQNLDVNGIERIEISWENRPPAVLRIVRPADLWLVETGQGGIAWPINTGNLRGAVRLLSQLGGPADPTASADTAIGAAAAITFTMRGGAQHRLEVGMLSIGGRTPVRIAGDDAGQTRLAGGDLARVFTPEGIEAWRLKAPFVPAGSAIDRIEMRTRGRGTVMERVSRGWALTEPVRVAADPAMAQVGVERLMAIQVAQFYPGADAADPAYGLDDPVARAELLWRTPDARDAGGGQGIRIIERLRVGNAVDPAATRVYAIAEGVFIEGENERPLYGPLVLAVDRATLDPVDPSPTFYAARRVLDITPADVGSLRLAADQRAMETEPALPREGVIEFERTLDRRWSRDGGPTLSETSAGIDLLLQVLSGEEATTLEVDQPAGLRSLATIALVSPRGPVVAELALGTVPGPDLGVGPGDPGLVVKSGSVYRIFRGGDARAVLAWLEAVLRG